MPTINFPIALMYLGTLAAGLGAWYIHSMRIQASYRKEIEEFRREIEQLAATIGLMKRGPPTMRPPNIGGMG